MDFIMHLLQYPLHHSNLSKVTHSHINLLHSLLCLTPQAHYHQPPAILRAWQT